MRRFWSIFLVSGLLIVGLVGCSVPESAELEPNIVNGEPAEPHEFPFMIRVDLSFGENVGGRCGGALLSDTWVVTAAHCIEDTVGVEVVAGDHNVAEDEGEQVIEVVNIVTREEYFDTGALDYDIALLELATPLELNDRVQPIPYASELVAQRSPVTVAGWGGLADGSLPNILQKVGLLTGSDEDCDAFDFEGAFCVVYDPEKTTNGGDSGGPLFVEDGLLGIVTFKIGDQNDTDAYYTSLPFFSDWIEEQTGIAPDGGGEAPTEPEPAPEPEPEPDPDTTTFEDSLAEGDVVLQPDDTYFELEGAATLSGTLSGPEDANFDLFLYEWDGEKWVQAARGGNPDSSEDLSYEAEAGYYAWLLYARAGSGDYTLTLTNAAR